MDDPKETDKPEKITSKPQSDDTGAKIEPDRIITHEEKPKNSK